MSEAMIASLPFSTVSPPSVGLMISWLMGRFVESSGQAAGIEDLHGGLDFAVAHAPPLIMPSLEIVVWMIRRVYELVVEHDTELAILFRRRRVWQLFEPVAFRIAGSRRVKWEVHGRAAVFVHAFGGVGQVFARDVERVHEHQNLGVSHRRCVLRNRLARSARAEFFNIVGNPLATTSFAAHDVLFGRWA